MTIESIADGEIYKFGQEIEKLRHLVNMTYLIIYIQPMMVPPEDVERYHKYGRIWSQVSDKLSEIHKILGTTPNYKALLEKMIAQFNEKRTDN